MPQARAVHKLLLKLHPENGKSDVDGRCAPIYRMWMDNVAGCGWVDVD